MSQKSGKSADRLNAIAKHLDPNKKDEALEKSEWKVYKYIYISTSTIYIYMYIRLIMKSFNSKRI